MFPSKRTMFPFPCPKCEQPCRLDEGLICSYCKKNSNTEAGMYESFDPEQPEIAVPGETDVAGASRNDRDPIIMPLDSTVLVQNGKKNEPNDQIIQNIVQHYKQSRQEICNITDRNRDLMQEANTARYGITSGYNHSVNIRDAFLENESQWNIGIFQGSQMDKATVKNASMNNESQWNIDQFQGSQKAPVKSDSHESVGVGGHSKYDISAIPGPSGFHGNQNELNMLDAESKSSGTSGIPKVVPRRIITCKICGEDSHKYTKEDSSRYTYFCCVCEYKTINSPNNLQVHIRIHCSKNTCSVCSKEYTEGPLHVSQQKCQFCGETYHCRTQRDEHRLLDHEKHFIENCWECCLPTKSHYSRIEGKKLYFCCMCGYETHSCHDIQIHNGNHCPKIFCKLCREEYPDKEKRFHNSKCSCIHCKKEFECRTQLEDHYKGDPTCVVHFSIYCRLCNEIINNHVVNREGNQYFKCCACPEELEKYNTRDHLHTHPGLGVFKCGTCGKRYQAKGVLLNHSKTCKASPFPCEFCIARFPSSDSLKKHCLEKHRQI